MKDILRAGLDQLGLNYSEDSLNDLVTFSQLLIERNKVMNLTAITEPKKIVLLHYADCAKLAGVLPKGEKMIDIGCGAGFPTLPLAIVRPDLKILAVDSTAKRINYVAETAALLDLDNVTAITMRAEDGGKSPEYREKFDYATARAVAEMRVLAELTLPFVKLGGQLVAMKGKNAEFELSAAKKAIATLGGRKTVCENVNLKGEDESFTHPLIIIDKKEKTPASFPRPYAQISKKPL